MLQFFFETNHHNLWHHRSCDAGNGERSLIVLVTISPIELPLSVILVVLKFIDVYIAFCCFVYSKAIMVPGLFSTGRSDRLFSFGLLSMCKRVYEGDYD